ncbi:MAG: choice-of-anchor P family protein [Candidatus Acidiferrum sp.]
MTSKGHFHKHWRVVASSTPRLLLFIATFLFLLLIGTRVANRTTFAGNTVGSFEIDGNLAVDHLVPPSEPIDWNSSPFPAALTTFTDGTGSTDDIFGQGSKENDQSSWVCTAGSAPQKDDVVNEISVNGTPPIAGEIAFRFFPATGVQKQFLYANWSRLSNNGDAHIDYEFNQADPSTSHVPGCPKMPIRTPGDFLVSFDTQFGGKIINVSAFTWNGTTFVPLSVGSQGILWDAAVNTAPSITGLTATGTNLFGELALNVSDTIGEIPCNKVLFVAMKTRASTSLSAELKDRTRVKPVNFTIFNPAGANASGNAAAAQIQDRLLAINQTLPAATPATCTQGVCSSQSGIGSTSNSNQVLNVAVPPPGGNVLRANVLSASSTSTVDSTTNTATDTGVAESAGVNLVGGLVTADVVRAVATAQASAFNSSFSSAGSAFKNLVVNGAQVNNVNPNTTIDLPAAQFGAGSFVKLFEEIGSSSQPPPGQLAGGTFAADLTVNMIRVHITGLGLTVDAIDVVVSHAQAHADFPQPAGCPSLVGTVSGNATIVNEQTNPSELPVVVGFVSIPPQGGHDHQDLDQLSTLVVSSGTSVSDSAGTVLAASSNSTSFAKAQNVCVVPVNGPCTVFASVIISQANSSSGGGISSSDAQGTSLLGLSVGGMSVGDNPPPNTTILVPGIGSVTFNEQTCDGGGVPPCSGATSSGIRVRAIHVIIDNPNALGVPQGADVIVGEAHADSSHP